MLTKLAHRTVLLSKIVFWMGVFTLGTYLIFPGTCPCCTPFLIPEIVCFLFACLMFPVLFLLFVLLGWQLRKSATPFPWRREFLRTLASVVLFGGFHFYLGYECSHSGPVTYASRLQTVTNLKTISLALERYAQIHGQYPPHRITPGDDGKPCHSWRVYLLPYLDQDALFQKIRLNEPWDSDWNRQFHSQMPSVFLNPLRIRFNEKEIPAGFTTFAVLTGANTLFPHDGPGHAKLDPKPDIDPVILAERQPVCWMNPDGDISVEHALEADGIQAFDDGIYLIGTLEAHVEYFNRAELESALRTLPEPGHPATPTGDR